MSPSATRRRRLTIAVAPGAERSRGLHDAVLGINALDLDVLRRGPSPAEHDEQCDAKADEYRPGGKDRTDPGDPHRQRHHERPDRRARMFVPVIGPRVERGRDEDLTSIAAESGDDG